MSLEVIKKVFEDVFDVDAGEVTKETTKDNMSEWDSLLHLEMVTKLENELGIKFTINQITQMDSVNAILSFIDSQKGPSSIL